MVLGAGLVVVLWAGIEMWRAWGQDTQKNVRAGGPGSVAVGGDAEDVETDVAGEESP
ncbi:hypothetical protein [Thermobifida halotolerans]|uniref:hypothetical protein n=1 Tax=Thermobifida halotolerans TaxID=483545 RepID=UPI000A74DD0D|nr:hypothetical protein [Thermobifida halotolerans]